jgi:hypothetical protein
MEELTETKFQHGPLATFVVGALIVGLSIFWHISRIEHRSEKHPVQASEALPGANETERLVSQVQFAKVREIESFFWRERRKWSKASF